VSVLVGLRTLASPFVSTVSLAPFVVVRIRRDA
jgi:hypothetical protein